MNRFIEKTVLCLVMFSIVLLVLMDTQEECMAADIYKEILKKIWKKKLHKVVKKKFKKLRAIPVPIIFPMGLSEAHG